MVVKREFANDYCQKVYEQLVKQPLGVTIDLATLKDAEMRERYIECAKAIIDCGLLLPRYLSIASDWSKITKY